MKIFVAFLLIVLFIACERKSGNLPQDSSIKVVVIEKIPNYSTLYKVKTVDGYIAFINAMYPLAANDTIKTRTSYLQSGVKH